MGCKKKITLANNPDGSTPDLHDFPERSKLDGFVSRRGDEEEVQVVRNYCKQINLTMMVMMLMMMKKKSKMMLMMKMKKKMMVVVQN